MNGGVATPDSAAAKAFHAEAVLLHGKIITVDPSDTVAQALAIRDGKIAVDRVGAEAHLGVDALTWGPRDDHALYFEARIEGHIHFGNAALRLNRLRLLSEVRGLFARGWDLSKVVVEGERS